MNAAPKYALVVKREPLMYVAKNVGYFKQVFEDQNFMGKLERVIIEFEIRQAMLTARDTAFGDTSVLANSVFGLLLVYKAFGPKKVLWRQTRGLIARGSEVLMPKDFNRVIMRPEEYVDFAVSLGEEFAKTYGLQVELVYHGDPFYARKYLPRKQP